MIGWLANAFLLAGSWAIAHKRRVGWPLCFVGNLLWAIVGYQHGIIALWAVELVFCCLNVYGGVRWKQ